MNAPSKGSRGINARVMALQNYGNLTAVMPGPENGIKHIRFRSVEKKSRIFGIFQAGYIQNIAH